MKEEKIGQSLIVPVYLDPDLKIAGLCLGSERIDLSGIFDEEFLRGDRW